MAQFHGTLQGNRGGVNRLGTRSSGMDALLHSPKGGIMVRLYSEGGEDRIKIQSGPHGREFDHTVYDGPIQDLADGKVRL